MARVVRLAPPESAKAPAAPPPKTAEDEVYELRRRFDSIRSLLGMPSAAPIDAIYRRIDMLARHELKTR